MQKPLSQNRYAYVMNNPVNYWDPTGRIPELIPDQLGEQFFTIEIDAGNYQKRWYYELQYYNSNTTTEKYRETIEERAIIHSWTEITLHEWNYFIEHRTNRLEDGTLQLVNGQSGHRSYFREDFKDIQHIITAEELMIANYEELARYGKPINQKVTIFEGHRVRKKLTGQYQTGRFKVDELINQHRSYNKLTPQLHSIIDRGGVGRGTVGGKASGSSSAPKNQPKVTNPINLEQAKVNPSALTPSIRDRLFNLFNNNK